MSKHILEKTVLDGQWDEWVERSENGSVFCLSGYLKSINTHPCPYYYRRNREIRAAVLVMETDDAKDTRPHDFVVYSGLLFAPPQANQNRSQILSEQFDISTFVAAALAGLYETVEIQLHPSIIDIRPFLWFNYGADGPKYAVDLRYTSCLAIGDFAKAKNLEDISIYLQASASRRQEIRYAIRDKVSTKEEFDPDRFVSFYDKTMKRQDISVESDILDEMNRLLTSLFTANMGRMFVSYTAHGEPGSMAFCAMDSKRAYYLFGANDPVLRKAHTGTAVLWDAFYKLAEEGIEEIDMEGVNSPQRGWFKLSFGGTLVPYYGLRCISGGK